MLRRKVLMVFLLLVLTIPFSAEFFCKRFDFVQERWIRLNQKAGNLEIQDVQFKFPNFIGPRKLNIRGRNEAVVNVKNYGTRADKVHVAIALFDGSGNLVGCGTTGSKLGATKPGETETYYVAFDYVHSRITTAKYFYLTVETEPVQ